VQRTVALVQLLCLTGVLGAVLRVAAVSASSRPTLLCFGTALAAALVGNVGYLVTQHDVVYVSGSWTDSTWIVGYACMGAAALHPAMAGLGMPQNRVVDALHDTRLAALATALLAAPLVVGVSQLVGRGSDTALLTVASVATVPLVMVRIRGLVHERRRAERELEHQATHDPLTGLANRTALLARLRAAHDRVRDGSSPGLCLLFCDLNGFKAVNDSLGHAAGDELLVAVAQRLATSVRAADVVARFGGDEFVVLCEGAPPAVVTGQVYPRIAAALREPVRLSGAGVGAGPSISASVGMAACGPDDDIGVGDLLRLADAAMYAAKRVSQGPRAGSVLQVATV
jgi:diguanylate cyclase (GGDEF)-like protein